MSPSTSSRKSGIQICLRHQKLSECRQQSPPNRGASEKFMTAHDQATIQELGRKKSTHSGFMFIQTCSIYLQSWILLTIHKLGKLDSQQLHPTVVPWLSWQRPSRSSQSFDSWRECQPHRELSSQNGFRWRMIPLKTIGSGGKKLWAL